MKPELQDYYSQIIEDLVHFGKLDIASATTLLDSSNLFDNVEDSDAAESMLLHEYPYYWAMHLLYAENNPRWYKDPKLWPPPEDYLKPHST